MGKIGASFKKRLREGEKLFGTHVALSDFSITEIIGNHGYDYIWIDTEHSAIDYQVLNQHILTAQSKGVAAIVRVPFVQPYLAKRVLEMGPDGIIFPMTNTRKMVQDAMDFCLYPPLGKRGFGPNRAADYGLRAQKDYVESLDDELCKFMQIEQREALDNIEDILSVQYIDGLIIGPMDLSFSLGDPGAIYTDKAKRTYEYIVEKATGAGLPVGVSVSGVQPADMKFWNDCGIRFISAGGDYTFLNQGASSLLASLKASFDKTTK